jgi:universal stress protein E
MMKADRILVHVRGSSADDPAVSRAFALAKRSRSRLMLLDVFDELPGVYEPLLSSLSTADAREEAQRERRGQLARIAALLHDHGVPSDFDVRWGRPAIELVQEVISGNHDLLVMEDDKPRGIHTVTNSVVRHCPAPVWIVKRSLHAPPPRILAAVDPIGPTPGAFDGKVLEIAAAGADSMDAELFVVHAWQPLHDEFEWLPDGFRRLAEKNDVIAETHMRHAHAVEAMIRSMLPHLGKDRYRLVEGPAADAVLEAVDETGADLLVIGTARSALYARLLFGKTAERILDHVPISILAVKPNGFVSPVSV